MKKLSLRYLAETTAINVMEPGFKAKLSDSQLINISHFTMLLFQKDEGTGRITEANVIIV